MGVLLGVARPSLHHSEKDAWHRGRYKQMPNSVAAFDERGGQVAVVFETALLEAVVERNKEAYYLALRQTQVTMRSESPDWSPWLRFFLGSVAEQVTALERKIEREQMVLSALPELSLRIVEFAREHGRITMSEALAITGAPRDTLKPHFRALVERGHLVRHGAGRGVWYGLS